MCFTEAESGSSYVKHATLLLNKHDFRRIQGARVPGRANICVIHRCLKFIHGLLLRTDE